MIAEPLEKGLAEDIENEVVQITWNRWWNEQIRIKSVFLINRRDLVRLSCQTGTFNFDVGLIISPLSFLSDRLSSFHPLQRLMRGHSWMRIGSLIKCSAENIGNHETENVQLFNCVCVCISVTYIKLWSAATHDHKHLMKLTHLDTLIHFLPVI